MPLILAALAMASLGFIVQSCRNSRHFVCDANSRAEVNPLRPTVAMDTAMGLMHPVPDRVKPPFVIFDIRTLTLTPKRQNARMSKITNDSSTRSGTGCFLAVPIWRKELM